MSNLKLQELHPLILSWAFDKGLLKKENAPKQRLKLLEEIGETAKAILQNNQDDIKDGVGDIFVVLVILYSQLLIEVDLSKKPYKKQEELLNSERLMTLIYYHDCEGFNQLHYLCLELNLDLIECANLAWNEIKDRTGKTINGTFIKN